MGLVMQGYGPGLIAVLGNGDAGVQYYRCEADFSVRRHGHCAGCVILIGAYNNAGICAQMQIPKHVTGGQGRNQQVFRIVFRSLAAKERICRPMQNGLALDDNAMITTIGAITGRALSPVAGPFNCGGVVVDCGHGKSPAYKSASGMSPPVFAIMCGVVFGR